MTHIRPQAPIKQVSVLSIQFTSRIYGVMDGCHTDYASSSEERLLNLLLTRSCSIVVAKGCASMGVGEARRPGWVDFVLGIFGGHTDYAHQGRLLFPPLTSPNYLSRTRYKPPPR